MVGGRLSTWEKMARGRAGRIFDHVSADQVTTPTLATLRRARGHLETTRRWLRPLGAAIVVLVAWNALNTRPGPGLAGQGLQVSVALAGLVVGGLGAIITAPSQRLRAANLGLIGLLFVASGALVCLQPNGAGVAGLVVAVSLLTRRVPARAAVPAAVATAVFLAVVMLTEGHGTVSALLDAILIAGLCGLWFMADRLTEANRQAEQLLVELEQTRAAEARAAGLAERQRLAREMHDVLAHSLSGLMLQLEGARMLAAREPGDPRLPPAIDRAHQLAKTGLEEARRAIGMLRDDELPGPERLAELAAGFEQDRGIPCQFAVCGEAPELSAEARLALYRVAQEALTNITRHAHPERVELRLDYADHGTRLTVEDFAPANGARPGQEDDDGYGLTGMRERAELLGGTLTTAMTASGFRVDLELPA